MDAAQRSGEPSPPLVSVCVINFNGEEFLRDSIGSILNQTHANLEIVFCDDGSTDSSVAVFEQMISEADRPISVVRAYSPENRGPESNMLRGLQSFNGEFVCNLDADDALSPVHVEVLLGLLRDTGCDVACTNSIQVEGKTSPEWREPPSEVPERASYRMLASSETFPTFYLKDDAIPFAYWHRMHRRHSAQRVAELPEDLFRNSDSAFSVAQACEARTVAFVDVPTYFHRIRSESVSQRSTYRYAREKIYGSLDAITERYERNHPELRELNSHRNSTAIVWMLNACVDERLGWREYASCYRQHVTMANRELVAGLLVPDDRLRAGLTVFPSLLPFGFYVLQQLRRFKAQLRKALPQAQAGNRA